jgi:hypothetical protein
MGSGFVEHGYPVERYRPRIPEPEPLDEDRTHFKVLRMQFQAIVD